jgi:hypothetical protein
MLGGVPGLVLLPQFQDLQEQPVLHTIGRYAWQVEVRERGCKSLKEEGPSLALTCQTRLHN